MHAFVLALPFELPVFERFKRLARFVSFDQAGQRECLVEGVSVGQREHLVVCCGDLEATGRRFFVARASLKG